MNYLNKKEVIEIQEIDKIYSNLVKDIVNNGISNENENVRPVYADGEKAYTKGVVGVYFTIPNSESDSFPILQSKKVGWKWAFEEVLWIWQQKSNNVNDLKKNFPITIWDEWADAKGSINKAYGYQLSKKCRNLNGVNVDQVDYLLYQLKNNPANRRLVVTLWNPDDLDEMALEPCVHTSHWNVKNGILDCSITIRSNDTALGNPYNIAQYAFLQRLIAKECGLKSGNLNIFIADSHVYLRHIDTLQEQINSKFESNFIGLEFVGDFDFYSFNVKDNVKLTNYNITKTYNFEVAI